jgi:hypothetical protein
MCAPGGVAFGSVTIRLQQAQRWRRLSDARGAKVAPKAWTAGFPASRGSSTTARMAERPEAGGAASRK